MAIRNLQCSREGDSIAVVWVWGAGQESASITVTRLLDGEKVASLKVEQGFYQQAINGPRHGPVLRVPPVPLRISVKDGDGEESFELVDKNYTVGWRLKKQNIYQRVGFFGRQELVRTDVCLQLRFPYEGQVPADLFCYVLAPPGERNIEALPRGYLPELHPGLNEYGVIPAAGRMIQLCCNPERREVSRLFALKRMPDEEL